MIEKASWIAPEGADKVLPCHFLASRKITFDEVPGSLTLQICCDSNYLLEINGQLVGRGPARGTRSIAFYDEYEIAGFIRAGENIFDVLVVSMNYQAAATQPVTPALRMAVGEAVFTDGSWDTYICNREFPENGPLFTHQSGYAEWRDMNFDFHMVKPEKSKTVLIPSDSPLAKKSIVRRDIPMPLETPVLPSDIPAADFVPPCDLSSIKFAAIATGEEHRPLASGDAASIYRLASGSGEAVTLPVPDDGGGISLVVDFGKEVSGRVEVEAAAASGTVLDIVYEEELYQGDRLRADHTHTNPTYQFCDRFILRAGSQTVGNILLDRGFRMVQLIFRNLTSPVTVKKIRAVDVRYPFAPRGRFFCSDYQLNRLWDVAKETISACTTDIFTDCPWRERLFYCNDMFIENRVALKAFGETAVHRRALRMIFSQRRADGLFTSVSPSKIDEIPEGKTNFHVILSGNLTLPLIVKEYLMHTGDLEMVREVYPQLKKMMERFRSWKDDRGIIHPPVKYWNFFDWSFELNGMEFNGKPTSLMNFLYIIAARAMLVLAGEIGADAVENGPEIERILKNTVETFYSEPDGYFLNTTEDPASAPELLIRLGVPPEKNFKIEKSSRLTHALALLSGVDSKLCAGILNEDLLTPELYYGIFIFDGFECLHDSVSAMRFIRQHWGKMLDSGTPTLWENGVHKIGKAGFGGSASLCHGFSSSPAAYLQSSLLGISPTAPGFRRFRFSPDTGELNFAEGIVPTPNGPIRVRWDRAGEKITAKLDVPENCIAETPAGTYSGGTHKLEWSR